MSMPYLPLAPTRGTVQQGPLDADLPATADDVRFLTPRYDRSFVEGAEPGSPAWHMKRLLLRLDARHEAMTRWNDYYEGRQPLAFASEKFRDAFGGRFRAFSSNFCALVVDGTRERMEVTGITMTSTRSAKRAWRIWQDNDMDAWSQIAHTEALVKGIAYALVEPGTLGDGPTITIEDALDAITIRDHRTRRTTAGLKRYLDEDGHLAVVLYMPDFVWKMRSVRPVEAGTDPVFMPDPAPDEPWPLPNPLGVVPLVALPNRPRLRVEGKSEIDPVMSNQDAVNKYRADALVAAEFAAFRQRWATGLEIPVDPKTGQQVEPFKAAVDRLWVVPPPDPDDPNPVETKFGEFSQTDLAPYQAMIESEVGAMASISRMPYHYLLGQPTSVPPSGESLKSSEAGMVAKVKTALIFLGEGWEEVMRLGLLAVGDPGSKDRAAECQWRDPETRNEAARADATVKVYTAEIIDRNEARLALGYEPVEEPPPEAAGPLAPDGSAAPAAPAPAAPATTG